MASIFDINLAQDVKAPVSSQAIPELPIWTVEYETNNTWKKKSFLNVIEAYSFYKKITDAISKKILQKQN